MLSPRRGIAVVHWNAMESLGTTGIYIPSDAPCIDLGAGKCVRLLRKLGGGGFGEVWEASIDGAEETAVIKRALRTGEDADAARQERLRGEARLLTGMQIDGVPRLLLSGEDTDGPYVLWERVVGPTGRALASSTAHTPLPRAALLHLAGALAETLAALHDEGIMHSDVKPENVLVGRIAGRGGALRPWLVDFGLARRADSAMTRITADGCTLGTHGFLDPRTVGCAEERDAASDVYGWAATVFEWHAGFPLFTRDQWWELLRLRESMHRGDADADALDAWMQWHLGGRRAAIDASRRFPALEAVLVDALRWPTRQHPRPTAHDCARRLRVAAGGRFARLKPDADGMPTLDDEGRRRAIAWIGAGIIAGIASLFALRSASEPPAPAAHAPIAAQVAPPPIALPTPGFTWTDTELRLTDERGILLAVPKHDAHVLGVTHTPGARVWVFSLDTVTLCTTLERLAPGSGAKLPSPHYACYGLALRQDGGEHLLLSFPRLCVTHEDGRLVVVRREDIGAHPIATLLRDWPGTVDRYLEGPPAETTTAQYLQRANAYLRTLKKAARSD